MGVLQMFPAWRCALANVSEPFAGRVAEHMVARFAAQCVNAGAHRCFAAAFEIRGGRRIAVCLRSLPGGPDVSEIAAAYDGSGHVNSAFFTISIDFWEDLWIHPEPVQWDVQACSDSCLTLK